MLEQLKQSVRSFCHSRESGNPVFFSPDVLFTTVILLKAQIYA